MLKKILSTLACLLMPLVFLTACGDKETKKTTTIVNDDVAVTEQPQKGGNKLVADPNKQLDLNKCVENVKSAFLNGDYPEMDLSISLPSEENDFLNIIMITVDRPESEEQYLWWMNDCLVMLNEEAVKQMPDKYAPASEGYYGGLFDEYAVLLTASCNEDIMVKWPVDQKIAAGAHDPLVLNETLIDMSDFE